MKQNDSNLQTQDSQSDTSNNHKNLKLNYKDKKKMQNIVLKNAKQSQLKLYRNTVKQIVKKDNFV